MQITTTSKEHQPNAAQIPILARMRKWLKSRSGRETVAMYVFALPWIVGFIAVTLYPIGGGLYNSLTNYDGFSPQQQVKFIGLDNYIEAFTMDDAVWKSLKNVALFGVVLVPCQIAVSFLLALLLNQHVKGIGIFRSIYYLPTIFPVTASVMLWVIITDKNVGLLNAFISLFRPNTAIHWLGEYPRLVLIMFFLWVRTGAGAIVLLAALQGVPKELKEAAMIDGANSWRIFRHIVMPLLSPVLLLQLVNGLIQSLQISQEPILMTPDTPGAAGGFGRVPRRAIYMYVNHVMVQVFVFRRYGYGIALLWILFVILVILSQIVLRTSRRWVYYEVDQK